MAEATCNGRIQINDWHTGACPNPPKVVRDGKSYCGVHDPERRSQRQGLKAEEERRKGCQKCGIRKVRYFYRHCPYCGTKYPD